MCGWIDECVVGVSCVCALVGVSCVCACSLLLLYNAASVVSMVGVWCGMVAVWHSDVCLQCCCASVALCLCLQGCLQGEEYLVSGNVEEALSNADEC